MRISDWSSDVCSSDLRLQTVSDFSHIRTKDRLLLGLGGRAQPRQGRELRRPRLVALRIGHPWAVVAKHFYVLHIVAHTGGYGGTLGLGPCRGALGDIRPSKCHVTLLGLDAFFQQLPRDRLRGIIAIRPE